MEIIKLLAQVMEDAGAVRKGERNTHQNFNFRGIDSVVNAVSPALRKHGVVVVPTINDCIYETVNIGQNRTPMAHVRVNATYTFHAPDGSSVQATVVAESMDSGDKATAKAMSVAFRTALLQTLCLPTDDVDPDADTFVRSEFAQPAPKPQRAQLGSRANQAPKPQQDAEVVPMPAQRATRPQQHTPAINPASEPQLKMIRGIARETDTDDETLHLLAGNKSLSDLNTKEANALITQLMMVKKGEGTLQIDAAGNAKVVKG